MSQTVTVYDVVSSELFSEFVEEVNEHLKQGWKLQGGIAIIKYSGVPYPVTYLQAMTIEREDADG